VTDKAARSGGRKEPPGRGPRRRTGPGRVLALGPSAQEREQIRRAFLGMALCHELKQPLHSLNLNAELLTKRLAKLGLGDGEKPPVPLDAPLLALARTVDRISDCLDAFSSRAAPEPVAPQPRDLLPVVEAALERARPVAQRLGVRLVLETGSSSSSSSSSSGTGSAGAVPVLELPMHAHQLAVAFDALLSNALHATELREDRADVVVSVSGSAGADEVRVEIADRGVGMAADVARRAFEIGFSTWGGDGTGLTVAKFIAYHHSGGFSMSSALEQGTTVTMVLPVTAE
jgi:signal transduction histidine kinase